MNRKELEQEAWILLRQRTVERLMAQFKDMEGDSLNTIRFKVNDFNQLDHKLDEIEQVLNLRHKDWDKPDFCSDDIPF